MNCLNLYMIKGLLVLIVGIFLNLILGQVTLSVVTTGNLSLFLIYQIAVLVIFLVMGTEPPLRLN